MALEEFRGSAMPDNISFGSVHVVPFKVSFIGQDLLDICPVVVEVAFSILSTICDLHFGSW